MISYKYFIFLVFLSQIDKNHFNLRNQFGKISQSFKLTFQKKFYKSSFSKYIEISNISKISIMNCI